MSSLFYPPTSNGLQKSLNANLDQGDTTSLTLNNTTGIQNKPGVIVINRIDTNGTVLSSSLREYISFTGVSGSTLTGLTRGLGGSSDQDHSTGEVVEFIHDVVIQQAVVDALANLVDTTTLAVDTTKVVTPTGTQTLTNKTLTSPVLTTPQINDTSSDHQYVFAGSELTADRTVTLPLLTGNDEFVFKDHAQTLTNKTINDWRPLGYTLTYASADSPTFTATVASQDLTGVLSPGMRLKLTQSTGGTKYFIITAVAFSTNTTITMYGGTDYTLNNEAITVPEYSTAKLPVGFPGDRAKWTVTSSDATERSQATPVQNTWYNLNSLSISIPIGSWDVSYKTYHGSNLDSAAGVRYSFSTLSTANNSESDAEFTSFVGAYDIKFINGPAFVQKPLTLASKTSYYLNVRTTIASMTAIYRGPANIRAVSAYL